MSGASPASLQASPADTVQGGERSVRARRILSAGSPGSRWELVAFGGALLVYAITHFWRLSDYPIYFFTDEAFLPLSAEHLLTHGLRNNEGHLLPFYFKNGGAWCPVFPVWMHVVSVALFGKSIAVARGTAAFFTLLGSAAAALTLKIHFRNPLWWSAPLVLATTPIFFLHSRTTFETVFMVSFLACFVLFYLLYRCRSPWFLYPAIVFGACTFYSYSAGQVVTALIAVLLGVLDLPYHVRQWRHVLPGLLLLAIVLVPLYRFRSSEPDAARRQLSRVSSYLTADLRAAEKARRFAREYGRGLDPRYWFLPHGQDVNRHAMLGYSYLPRWMEPAILVGLAVCLWRIRSAPHRTVLVCLIAAPAGAAIAAVAATRVLSVVLPAALLAIIGAGTLFLLVPWPRGKALLAAGVFLFLTVSSFSLLADALENGPLWYRSYGLYGQQWGAKQVFENIRRYLDADPENRIALSPNWANGTDLYIPFFLNQGTPDFSRVGMGTLDEAAEGKLKPSPKLIFVTTPSELADAARSRRFDPIPIDRELKYPDGTPGFYFVRVAYSPKFDEIRARDREALRTLQEGQAVVGGETWKILHPRMDIGRLEDIFDGNPDTLARFNAANPAVLEIHLPRPRRIRRVFVSPGTGNWEIVLKLQSPGGKESREYEVKYPDTAPNPRIEIPIDKGPSETEVLRLEIRLVTGQDFAIIHLRELELR